jgi:hypothetical protein
MEKGITFVGMDAHKVAIKQAVLLPEQSKPVEWQLANEKAAVRRMVRKVQRLEARTSSAPSSAGWRRLWKKM